MATYLLGFAWPAREQLAWATLALAIATGVVLCILMVRLRWGQAKALARNPLAKYIALSLVAHIVLAIAAYFAHVFDPLPMGAGDSPVVVTLGDDFGKASLESPADAIKPEPWDPPATAAIEPPIPELPRTEETPQLADRPEIAPAPDTRVASPLATLSSLVADEMPEDIAPFSDAFPPAEAANVPVARLGDPVTETIAEAAPEAALEEKSRIDSLTEANAETQPGGIDSLDADESTADANVLTGATDQPTSVSDPTQREFTELPAAVVQRTLTPVSTTSSPERGRQPLNGAASGNLPEQPMRPLAAPRRADGRPIPTVYRDRWASDRLQLARRRGGDANTEAAVQASLQWLALSQSTDGRWDASEFGGGGRTNVGGHDRGNAGREADTGITGLALLAFLGAGHTQTSGDFQEVIERGLQFLLAAQRTRQDGSLVGNATHYAAMYCHGIASLAISEAYALTGDARLRVAMQRAIGFTISTQHSSGGWRYEPHQPGDTSQLGWQLMALTSAHYAGVQIPSTTWSGAGRFLQSVSSGRQGGLSAYRPGHPTTTSMTAEGLLCRLLTGTPVNHPLVEEASSYVMTDLPSAGQANYYYWYYGTLAMFHLQNTSWDRWNTDVKSQILSRQVVRGSLAGSWDPDSVWGAIGGRVYTTALATLTLEVYYRFRPLSDRVPERTAWRGR